MHDSSHNRARDRTPGLWPTVLALSFGLTIPAFAEDFPVAFTHATIETAGKAGRIENGTLILRGGKVEAVGDNVRVPDDARVIDARGKTIMPGILDPFHEVSIAGSGVDAAPRPMVVGRRGRGGQPARGGSANAAFTRIADNFYPYDSSYRALLRSGLTGLNLVTSGYGQAAIVRLTPAQPDRMMVNPDGFLFTAVTSDTSSLDIVRTALETAEKIKKGMPVTQPSAPAATTEPAPTPEPRARPGRRRGAGRPAGPGGGGPGPGLDSARLKLWQAVYEGKTPFFANAANAAAIVHLLKAIEPYKDVKLALVAPGPALYETIDYLTVRQARLLIQPGLSLKPNTRDRIDVAHLLHEAHLEFAFTQTANRSDLLAAQDFPLFPVAYLVKCGLPREVALEGLTARPAALLGLDKTHGTIEPGKSADLLIFTGDPLDPGSQLSQVLIEGRTVYEN
jgi:hypothetical protein